MSLTEKKVVKLIREAYDKRLNYFLSEKMNVETMGAETADQLKVMHGPSRLVYTYGGVNAEGLVMLYLPEEPRFEPSEMGQQRLLSDYVSESEDFSDELPEVDSDRDYIFVSIKEFEREYELA